MPHCYERWTPEETERLLHLVNRNTSEQGRIDWIRVSASLPNRSYVQCKSFYTNVLKGQLNLSRQNFHWSAISVAKYIIGILLYGKDIQVIHDLFFPQLKIGQLKTKYKFAVVIIQELESRFSGRSDTSEHDKEVKMVVEGLRYRLSVKNGGSPQIPDILSGFPEILQYQDELLEGYIFNYIEHHFGLEKVFQTVCGK